MIQRMKWSVPLLGATVVVALLVTVLGLLATANRAHAQQPALNLDLTLENNPVTLKPGDIFTQRVQLGYTGGNVNIDAVFVQEFPSGIRPIAVPIVTEQEPQTVTPLQVQRRGRMWGWQGKMRPESFLVIVVPYRVQQCYGDDQQINLSGSARRTPNGENVTDSASVTIDCVNQTIADIVVSDKVIYADGSESESGDALAAAGSRGLVSSGRFYLPGKKQILRVTLTNQGTIPTTVGVEGNAKCCRCLTCTVAAAVYATDLNVAETIGFRQLYLAPGESRTIEQPMVGAPTINDPGTEGEYSYGGDLVYCLSQEGETTCPDPQAAPQLAKVHTIAIPVRPNDLGDAPDSTNHFGTAMAAYPGVQANFPTVYHPATPGTPIGPRHLYPQFLHLGERFSREAEADIGPDDDPTNNIRPAMNRANRDRGDDGANPGTWSLQHCQATEIAVEISVSAAALTWYQEAKTPAYLNAWLDFNRDGDWADNVPCRTENGGAQQDALEHFILDFPVDVAALSVGVNTINVKTGIVNWPAAQANQPAWARLTLSERESAKGLRTDNGVFYGDGRGESNAFRTGETEDYLLPTRETAVAPDLELQVTSLIEEAEQGGVTAAQADSIVVDFSVRYLLEYGNKGPGTANGALLEFQIPEKLQGIPPSNVTIPGIDKSSLQVGTNSLRLTLPTLEFGGFGRIILGWTGCLTCTLTAADLAAPTADFTASAKITLAGDSDETDNSVTTTPRRSIIGAGIGGIQLPGSAIWRKEALTCQDTMTFVGRGRPGATLLLRIDPLFGGGEPQVEMHAAALNTFREPLTATVQIDPNGIWRFTQGDLQDGAYRVGALYQRSGGAAANLVPLAGFAVDSSLTVDPMSFQLVDERGRTYFPPVVSRLGNFEIQDFHLPAGDYTASVLACPGQIINELQFKVGEVIVDAAPAADDCTPAGSDKCGPWSAKVTIPGSGVLASGVATVDGSNGFEIVAATDANQNTFSGTVMAAALGTVKSKAGATLNGATVTLLQAVPTSGTDGAGNLTTGVIYVPWNGTDYGQENPLTTDADGSYSFAAPAGTYRVQVEQRGFQAHVTGDIEQSEGELIARDVTLVATIDGDADYEIAITEDGFTPSMVTVEPGSTVRFVSATLGEANSQSNDWNSGILQSGNSYTIQLTDIGTYRYMDGTNPLNMGTIIVDEAVTAPTGTQIFLPVVVR